MNKYQEALVTLRNIQVYKYASKEFHDYQVDYENSEEVETLQELVDRATPTKPTRIERLRFVCKKCGLRVYGYEQYQEPTHHFCPNCGQALDWSKDGPTK